MRIMFENYYSVFHYCLLSCGYVMLQKSILNELKWGHKQSLGGDGTPVAMALATSTKNNTPVANFVNSRQKTTKPNFEKLLQVRT